MSADEWEKVRLHAYHSERVLCRSTLLAALASVAASHHEHVDGSGYHRALSAAALTPSARLLAAADAYHAMTEPRPHRPALSADEAAHLLSGEAWNRCAGLGRNRRSDYLYRDIRRPGGVPPRRIRSHRRDSQRLEAGPGGWIQQLNFVLFGLLTIGFAVGMHVGVRQTSVGILGPALLFMSGVGSLLAAVFPLMENADGVTYDPGGHVVAGIMFFSTSAVGLIVLSRRLARDARWQSIAGYTRGAGIVALAGFFTLGALVMPDDAPLHDWAGLAQRALILVVLFPCRIVLSRRLLQVANGRR